MSLRAAAGNQRLGHSGEPRWVRRIGASTLARVPIRRIRCHRSFATTGHESLWEDQRQLAEIKPAEFYEVYGAKRQYFYHVNLSGQLFIEDAVPKNLTSCLKNDKFLDFFFSRLQPNETGEHEDYPLCSPCGREMNFIKPADKAGGIVLTDFDGSMEGSFRYGATGCQPLDPASLMFSSSGRLYHGLTSHRASKGLGGVALVKSHVALTLCEDGLVEFGDEGFEGSFFIWRGERHPIRLLPTN